MRYSEIEPRYLAGLAGLAIGAIAVLAIVFFLMWAATPR
jgi:uncharacterized membrane protein